MQWAGGRQQQQVRGQRRSLKAAGMTAVIRYVAAGAVQCLWQVRSLVPLAGVATMFVVSRLCSRVGGVYVQAGCVANGYWAQCVFASS